MISPYNLAKDKYYQIKQIVNLFYIYKICIKYTIKYVVVKS